MKQTAIITGATSGIGASFANKLAAQGYNLVITGRRKKELQSLADEIETKQKVSVLVQLLDLDDNNQLEKFIKYVKTIDNMGMLVNNAGFGTYDDFWKQELSRQEKMVAVHVLATMKLVYGVLPMMIKNKKGFIINVSSLGSFLPLRKNAVYAGTKAFLTIFTESLHLELLKTGIRVQVLCPGFTRTNFHQRIDTIQQDMKELEKLHWMSADKVVDCSLASLRKNRVVCVPGFRNRLIMKIVPFIPRGLYYRIVQR